MPREVETLRVSEIFESLQGEGVSLGMPCVFVRLAHCNLRCRWCDTPYSWDFERYSYAREVTVQKVSDLAASLRDKRRIVLTGGEPLLQVDGVSRLVAALPVDIAIEVETNGTVKPSALLQERVDQWNVSPKLGNSGESRERAEKPEALAALRDTGRAWLKFVVQGEADFAEAEALRVRHSWPAERVLFMAEATTRAELRERGPLIAEIAARRGARYTPRLHLELWDGRRGT